MKAILVIDIDDIDIENTQVTYIELKCQNYTEGMSLVNHWLKPLPQRKKFDNQIPYKKSGWNDCLDEILEGETE